MERPKAVLRGPFGGGSFTGQLPDWLFAQEVGPEDALLAGRTGRGSSPPGQDRRARTAPGSRDPREREQLRSQLRYELQRLERKLLVIEDKLGESKRVDDGGGGREGETCRGKNATECGLPQEQALFLKGVQSCVCRPAFRCLRTSKYLPLSRHFFSPRARVHIPYPLHIGDIILCELQAVVRRAARSLRKSRACFTAS